MGSMVMHGELTEYCAKSRESRETRAYFLARYRQEIIKQ